MHLQLYGRESLFISYKRRQFWVTSSQQGKWSVCNCLFYTIDFEMHQMVRIAQSFVDGKEFSWVIQICTLCVHRRRMCSCVMPNQRKCNCNQSLNWIFGWWATSTGYVNTQTLSWMQEARVLICYNSQRSLLNSNAYTNTNAFIHSANGATANE